MSKIITTHLTLDSPVEDVWETLTTLSGYGEWNPFITSASGTLALGERLDLTIHPPGGRPWGSSPGSPPWTSIGTWSGWAEWGCLASSTAGTASHSRRAGRTDAAAAVGNLHRRAHSLRRLGA